MERRTYTVTFTNDSVILENLVSSLIELLLKQNSLQLKVTGDFY